MFWLWRMLGRGRVEKDGAEARDRKPPVISVTLTEVKLAVRELERQLPEGVCRTILIGQDNEINCRMLLPYLHGTPDRRFYMSWESYEIFPEEQRHIPQWLDVVQRAVDHFILEENTLPLVPGDGDRKISYPILINRYYLKERPPIDFYLSRQEDLISHLPQQQHK